MVIGQESMGEYVERIMGILNPIISKEVEDVRYGTAFR